MKEERKEEGRGRRRERRRGEEGTVSKISQRRFRRFLRRPVRSVRFFSLLSLSSLSLSPPAFKPAERGRDRNTILSRGCTDTSAFHFFPSVCVTKFLFFASPLSTFLTPPPWPSCFSTSLFPVFFSSSSSSSSSLFLGRFFLYTLRRGSTGLLAPP